MFISWVVKLKFIVAILYNRSHKVAVAQNAGVPNRKSQAKGAWEVFLVVDLCLSVLEKNQSFKPTGSYSLPVWVVISAIMTV